MWGVGVQYYVYWVVLVVGFGILIVSVVVGGLVVFLYNIDCYKDILGDIIIVVILVCNLMGFVIVYGIMFWYINMGF